MEVYLLRDGAQTGPFDPQQISAMLAEGRCQMSDLAWSVGLPEWRPLEAVLSLGAPLPPPSPPAVPEKPAPSKRSGLSPLLTRGKFAGFWCIPRGWSFLKLGIPTQHHVEDEIIVPTLLSARTYPALTVLAQSKFLTEHFPWLSLHMRRELDESGKDVFTAPGPARTHAYLHLINALKENGWSFVLQNGDTALLGAGSKLEDYADALQLELSGRKLNDPTHVRLQGIRSIATVSAKGEISDPLPISEALDEVAQ